MKRSNSAGYWERHSAYSGKPAMPLRVLPPAAAGLLMVFVVLGGANTGLLGAMLAMVQSMFAACVFTVMPRDRSWWRWMAPVALPVALLTVWAALPAFGIGTPLSPDLHPLGMVELMGQMLFLLAMIALGGQAAAYRRCVDWMAAMTAPVIGLSLLLPGMIDMGWLNLPASDPARFSGSLGNPNVAAVIFGMFALISGGVAMGRFRNWLSRPTDRSLLTMGGAAVLCVMGMCLLAATQSRTGVMLFLLAQAVLCTCALLFTKNGAMPGRRRITACIAILCAIFGTLAMLALDRFEVLPQDSLGRLSVWQKFWGLARQAPSTGYGLGSFIELNQRHLSVDDALSMWDFGAAHASPLHVWLELGWPGLALTLGLIGAMTWRVLRLGRLHADPIGLSIVLAVIFALGASLVDIDLNVPAVMAVTLGLAGLAYGRATTIACQLSSAEPPATRPETMRNW